MSAKVFAVGNKVFIRTVTHYHVGRVVEVDGQFVVLAECSWIADTGHYGVAMSTGKFAEGASYPKDVLVNVNRGAIVDCNVYNGDLNSPFKPRNETNDEPQPLERIADMLDLIIPLIKKVVARL